MARVLLICQDIGTLNKGHQEHPQAPVSNSPLGENRRTDDVLQGSPATVLSVWALGKPADRCIGHGTGESLLMLRLPYQRTTRPATLHYHKQSCTHQNCWPSCLPRPLHDLQLIVGSGGTGECAVNLQATKAKPNKSTVHIRCLKVAKISVGTANSMVASTKHPQRSQRRA